MIKFISALLLATAIVSGCQDGQGKVSTKYDEPQDGIPNAGSATDANNTKDVIVLCDVSNSIDSALKNDKGKKSQVFDKMKSLCQSILRANEPNTNFYFYFVSQNSASNPFFAFTSESWSKTTKYKVRNNFKTADSLISYRIDSAFIHNEKYTCLMTSIEHCFLVLKSLKKQNHATESEFIIFSDMIEECEESPVRKIMMNAKPGNPLLPPEQVTKLENYNNPIIDFDGEQIEIKIIFNTSGIDDKPKKAIMHRWKLLLAKYGYKAATTDATAPFIEVPDFRRNKAYEVF